MNRRDAFALRNTGYTQLNTRRCEYGNGCGSRCIYSSAGYTYEYLHEWAALPESVWGYPVQDVAVDREGRALIVLHGGIWYVDAGGGIEGHVDIPAGPDMTYEISLTGDGRIWLLTVETGELLELDREGRRLDSMSFKIPESGRERVDGYLRERCRWRGGHGGREFFMPHGMTEDSLGRIWYCDQREDRLLIWDRAAGPVAVLDQFFSAVDAAAGEGVVYVLEADGRISICRVDTLKTVAQIGFWQCQDIMSESIGVDGRGNLYLTDLGVKGLFKLRKCEGGRGD